MLITTIGAFVLAAGVAVTFVAMLRALRGPATAPADPWNGGTLEWATSSPPPPYNFDLIRHVTDRTPLWQREDQPATEVVFYHLRDDSRETLGTSILDAVPQQRVILATNSIWPLILALAVGVTFIGSIISLALVPVGAF